ncbi:MAG: Wzz/FepE/Etk N-terminal domain-containing protein [Magnetococcus sp. YQC-5]
MISTPNPSSAQPQSPMPMMYIPPPPPAGDLIDMAELWRLLLNQKGLILFFAILGAAGAFVIAKQMTPIYQAEVLLQPITDDGKQGGALAQLGGLAALAGINIGGGSNSKAALLARLQSRIFIEEFVRTENLLPLLFDELWDKKNKNWKFPDKIPKIESGVGTFQGILKIREEKTTSLVYLTVDWKDPELASRWANLVVEQINQYLRSNAVLEAKKNMEYLNVELAKTQIVEIKQVIAGLLENQIKKIMLANVNNEFAFKIIDPAVVPETPIKPKRKLMVIIGGVVGLLLGIIAALIRNNRRSKKPTSKTPASLSSK